MNRVSQPPRAVYAAAVEALAERVVRALDGMDDSFRLAEQLPADDELAGLAAVRVLGPDALAPYTVGDAMVTPEDAELVAAAFAAFPADGSEPGGTAAGLSVSAARDWATGDLLRRLGAGPPLPASDAAPWAGWVDGHAELGWTAWTGLLAQLAPLVSPGLDSPIHDRVRRRPLDTARGVTRAVLRRDHLTAARLVRWLVLTGPTGSSPAGTGLEPEPLLRHLELLGGADPRLRLEIALARATAERQEVIA